MKLIHSLIAGLALLTSGCSDPKPEEYKNAAPTLDLKSYLNGNFEAWGMIQQPNGKVIKHMKATLHASWQGDAGTLKEHFVFSDGKEQTRQWSLTRIDDHHYTATAEDCVGVANIEVYGNAMRWAYTLNVPVDDKIYALAFDDWLYLVDDGVMLNRARMKKFGFTVGELFISFRKQ